MSRLLAVAFLVAAALTAGAPAALAGPGCPDKPGVCAPGSGPYGW